MSDESEGVTFTLREAQALVEAFGGDDAEMTVRRLPAREYPAGLYAYATDYPEEGSIYLGPAELSDEAAE